MSGTPNDQPTDNVFSIHGSEAERIRKALRLLSDQIVTAWNERGVLLSSEERTDLRQEIKDTCEFLTDLTRHP
ncbi:hypothetical protein GCM10023264_12030 [Sphingomonas daechungensis]|uniref:Uncharacterized protein n=1 Tax=Sphingomonas daechungensis TaxID=1176646 RepID=A0ABX6SY25_9SPHN|nr:hypothetical protein [Sphingomonas daechungensis]QNP42370.1 hypothetical protein H9L15_08550 [Sphingomonas daechungensis]